MVRYSATIAGAEALRKLAKDLESSSGGVLEATDKLTNKLEGLAEKGPELYAQMQSIAATNAKTMKENQEPVFLLSQNLQAVSSKIMMLLGNAITPDASIRTGDKIYEEFSDGIASGSLVLEEPDPDAAIDWADANDIVGARYYDDVSDEEFWNHHGNTKEMYQELASKVPDVQTALDSGRSLDDLRQDPDLGACASQFFTDANMIRVYKYGGKYIFDGDGRHRVAAAQELGILIPVKIIRVAKRTNA